jgi:hypothetical protein
MQPLLTLISLRVVWWVQCLQLLHHLAISIYLMAGSSITRVIIIIRVYKIRAAKTAATQSTWNCV